MGEDGLQLFGGDWTERKLDALERYLRAYVQVLKKQHFQRIYIDAFAGTGYRQQEARATLPGLFADDLSDTDSQRFLDGSARIALKVAPAFDRYVFIERDPQRAAELEKLRTEFPSLTSSITIEQDDANQSISRLCQQWDWSRWRGVLFLDPFGMQAEWATLEAVAATHAIVWILFPLAVNRLLTRNPADIPPPWRERLNRTFGTSDWESQFYRQRAVADMFSNDEGVIEKAITLQQLGDYYRNRLKTVFPVVAENPAVLRNSRNSPLFQLHFAAANGGRGGKIAMKIAQHILTKI